MFFLFNARAEGSVRSQSKDRLLAAASAISAPAAAPGIPPMTCAILKEADKSGTATRRNACAIVAPTARPRIPPTKVHFSARRTKIDRSFVKRTANSLLPVPLQTSSLGIEPTFSSVEPPPLSSDAHWGGAYLVLLTLDGQTQGDTAGVSLPDGFRWKAILDAAVTREVTAADEREGQVKSPDWGTELVGTAIAGQPLSIPPEYGTSVVPSRRSRSACESSWPS